jgi:hypothetical protein
MEKMIIKVTLNSRNAAEAELMGILESVRNRNSYLKMAALHYCNIPGILSHADESRKEKGPDVSKTGGNSDPAKKGIDSLKKADEMDFGLFQYFRTAEIDIRIVDLFHL